MSANAKKLRTEDDGRRLIRRRDWRPRVAAIVRPTHRGVVSSPPNRPELERACNYDVYRSRELSASRDRRSLGLPPQTIAMYREQLAAIDAELGHRVEEAEAFRIILERARGCPDGASAPAQISICSHCGRGWQEGVGGRAELAPAELEKALCDAEHLGAVDGEQTRKKSTLTERKRKRIIARDKHRCAVPGCRSKKWLDVHHIKHREHGGGNADSNLITLCSGHHAAHHAGKLAVTGLAPDRVCFDWNRVGEDAHRGTNECQAHVGVRSRALARFGQAVMTTQARDALVGLGWKTGIALAAVEEACAFVGTDVPIERLIQEALRRCPRPLG